VHVKYSVLCCSWARIDKANVPLRLQSSSYSRCLDLLSMWGFMSNPGVNLCLCCIMGKFMS